MKKKKQNYPDPIGVPDSPIFDANDAVKQAAAYQKSANVVIQTPPAPIQNDSDGILIQPIPHPDIENENWFHTYWRPMAAWVYLTICVMDFIVFPTVMMMVPVVYKAFGLGITNYVAWQPITLTNSGLLHLSFGSLLGITSYMRSREKLGS